MNVGIYFDLRNPGQWAVDPARLYGFTLEMCSIGGMPEEHVARHVRTLCTRLAPLLAACDPQNATA